MRVAVLASGSKGNVTFVEAKGKRFLLDAGRNCKYIEEKLQSINYSLKDIDYCLITHDHSDHISALKTMLNKNAIGIIISPKALYNIDVLDDYEHIIMCDEEIDLDGVKIISIHSSHDAVDARNFIIMEDDKKLAYITDTGYINNKYFKILKNADIYLFESNHDIELLQHGPYPAWTKKRILSDVGHLSNQMAGFYLSKLIGDKTQKVFLIHLSETNNLEELALETVNNTLNEYGINFHNIECAKQNERTELVEI